MAGHLDLNQRKLTRFARSRRQCSRGAPLEPGSPYLCIGPIPLFIPDVYLRLIEPLIAIVLDAGMRWRDPPAPSDPLSLPSLGVSSLDLGRLFPRQAALVFVYGFTVTYSASKVYDPIPYRVSSRGVSALEHITDSSQTSREVRKVPTHEIAAR